jgi:hypothetical protein
MSETSEWVKADWLEGGKEMEDTIPSNWVLEADRKVAWPPDRKQERKAYKNHEHPAEDWLHFDLVKIKIRSGTSICKQIFIIRMALLTY